MRFGVDGPLDVWAELHAQFVERAVRDRRGSLAHQVGAFGGLREGDDVADRRLACQDHNEAVETQRDAAVRRRAVLERLQEETEAVVSLFLGKAESRKYRGLHVPAVNTN